MNYNWYKTEADGYDDWIWRNSKDIKKAIESKNIKYLNELTETKQSLFFNQIDGNGGTILLYAIYYENYDAIDIILKINPNINNITPIGNALDYAINTSMNEQMIEYLVNKGAKLSCGSTVKSLQNLVKNRKEYLIETKNKEPEKKTLFNGRNINFRDDSGETVLFQAICKEDYKLIKELLALKIDCNIKNNKGNTALANTTNISIIVMLLPFISNHTLNLPNFHKRTILMNAAIENDIELIKLLVNNFADIYIKDYKIQKTALDWNKKYHKLNSESEVAEILKYLNTKCETNSENLNIIVSYELIYMKIIDNLLITNHDNEVYRVWKLIKKDLTKDSLFWIMPASIDKHHSTDIKHGLLTHSLEVYNILNATIPKLNVHRDMTLFAGLIHDLYKIDEYIPINDEQYKHNKNTTGEYHIKKLVEICNKANAPFLASLIGSHHGLEEFNSIHPPKDAYATLLHFADMSSCISYGILHKKGRMKFPIKYLQTPKTSIIEHDGENAWEFIKNILMKEKSNETK